MKLLVSGARLLVALCVAILLCEPSWAHDHRRIIFFGDSLTDPGNYFIEFGQVSQPPFEPVPSAPYDIGGHHFSNGATWAEDISKIFRTPTSGLPALRAPDVFTNYAVGRARARSNAPVFSAVDLTTEVNNFLSDFGSGLPHDAVYVIWIGADDINDALSALATDPTGTTSSGIVNDAITAVVGNIRALYSAGARSFLILNEPDLSLTPFVRSLGPAAVDAASQISLGYDGALDQAVDYLQLLLPGIQLLQFDVNALFQNVVSSPHSFGLENVQDPCLRFGVNSNFVCAKPNRYLFWDGIHPTKVGHAILALAVTKEVVTVAFQKLTN